MGQLSAGLCTMNRYFNDIECEKNTIDAKRSLKVKPKRCVCLQVTIVFLVVALIIYSLVCLLSDITGAAVVGQNITQSLPSENYTTAVTTTTTTTKPCVFEARVPFH